MRTLLKRSLMETNFSLRIKDPHQRELIISHIKEEFQIYVDKKYKDIRTFFKKKEKKDEDVFIGCVEEEIQKAEGRNSEEKYFEGF